MPYGYRKTKNGYTVFKKDTGEIVGHTTAAKLKDYLAALHIHAKDEDTQKENMLRSIIREEIKKILNEMIRAKKL